LTKTKGSVDNDNDADDQVENDAGGVMKSKGKNNPFTYSQSSEASKCT
jgi:hypothetical protein